jgi:hypothetical protein
VNEGEILSYGLAKQGFFGNGITGTVEEIPPPY